MGSITKHSTTRGFALPTVMITSVTMMIILTVVLVSVTASSAAMRSQYYNRIMKEASEAGTAMANECLKKNNYVAQWSANPLRPNTDCTGTVVAGASAYVLDTTALKSTFEVAPPVTANGSQVITSRAILNNYRTSNGAKVSQSLSYEANAVLSAQMTFGGVTMGSSFLPNGGAQNGAHFSVIKADGSVASVGKNSDGRLGNGVNTTDAATPTTFKLPLADPAAKAVFSDFNGLGRYVSVLTTKGSLYSAGINKVGELGSGNTTQNQYQPQLYDLTAYGSPPPTVNQVGVINYDVYGQYGIFGWASDGNLYAAGACKYGTIGVGNGTGSGLCSSSNSGDGTAITRPKRVDLPVYNAANPATVIAQNTSSAAVPNNIVIRNFSSYVRMQSGDVYGWGYNIAGALATGDVPGGTTVSPIKIMAKKSTTQPVAKSVVSNGGSLYIVDQDDQLWASGYNYNGQQIGAGTYVASIQFSGQCIYVNSGVGNKVFLVNNTGCAVDNKTADPGDWHSLMEWWPDGTWRVRKSAWSTTRTDLSAFWCMEAPGTVNSTANSNIIAKACAVDASGNPIPKQVWQLNTVYNGEIPYFTIKSNYGTAGCVRTDWYNNPLYMWNNCSAGEARWQLQSSMNLRPVPALPGGRTVKKLVISNTGNYVIDSNGEVWVSGGDNRGQLCIAGAGGNNNLNLPLKKVTFPASANGLKVVDVVAYEAEPNKQTGEGSGFNTTYMLMSDGSVYGCGANDFGQLGIGTQATNSINATPTRMSKLDDLGVKAKDIQTSFGTTIILSQSGLVYTVGNNSNGQLGNTSVAIGSYSSTPVLNNYATTMTPIQY